MATPMTGDASITAAAVPHSPPSPAAGGGSATAEAPVPIFVYFHKAIRAELERLHAAAVRLATERAGTWTRSEARCRFLFSVYRHHCDAEDAVIFPALDIQVKNVAGTYSLEHKRENDLFVHLFSLLKPDVQIDDGIRRELASCTGTYMSKEEEQVYFGMLDGLLAAEQLPEEYRDRCQDILCNDCERKGTSRFHWLYHKCGFCGSYNTRVIKTDTVECSTSN